MVLLILYAINAECYKYCNVIMIVTNNSKYTPISRRNNKDMNMHVDMHMSFFSVQQWTLGHVELRNLQQ